MVIVDPMDQPRLLRTCMHQPIRVFVQQFRFDFDIPGMPLHQRVQQSNLRLYCHAAFWT